MNALDTNIQADRSCRGHIDSVRPARISGWAWAPWQGSRAVSLDVLIDGRIVGSCNAEQYRGDLRDAGIGDGHHGFVLLLDPPIDLTSVDTVSIRSRESLAVIATSRLHEKEDAARPSDELLGQIDVATAFEVSGWACRRDGGTVSVVVAIDGKPAGTVPATSYRADLADAGVRGGKCGFRIRIDAGQLAPGPHVAHAMDAESNLPIGVSVQFETSTSARNRRGHSFDEEVRRHVAARPTSGSDPNGSGLLEALRFLHSDDAHDAEPVPFSFPAHDNPIVSVIVPVHDQFRLTWRCLQSLRVATDGVEAEIIVVDDASSDETTRLPALVAGLRYVRQEVNRHFVLSCNNGARMARGRFLHFLNNDVELQADACRALLATFTANRHAGVVGSKLLFPDGRLQEAGGELRADGVASHVGRGQDPGRPEFSYLRGCDYVSGASLMIPRELFERVGGFDTLFAPAYCEDSDLCLRVRSLGREVLCQPLSVGVHDESASRSPRLDWDKESLVTRNRAVVASRWEDWLRRAALMRGHRVLPEDVGSTGRCLFIDWRTPRVDTDAGGHAATQEMLALRALGLSVTCATFEMDHGGHHTERLQALGIECVYAPYYGTLESFLARRGADFDVVYAMRYELVERTIEDIRRHAPAARLIFNCADVHAIREHRAARLQASLGAAGASRDLRNAANTRARELAVMRQSDLVVVYNETEAEYVAANVPDVPVEVLPWSVPAARSVPGWDRRRGVGFLGSAVHAPNLDAIDYFVREVWPLARARCADIEFHVYGAGLESRPERPRWEDVPGVKVVGYVPDAEQAFERHRVFVAPLRFGSGIKGKVVMALSNGVPSVITSVASEGLGVSAGREVAVADDPQAFAELVVSLHQHPDQWSRMSTNALRHAEHAFSEEKLQARMRAVLTRIGIPTTMRHTPSETHFTPTEEA